MLPQLSCGNTCQIWTWFKAPNIYFFVPQSLPHMYENWLNFYRKVIKLLKLYHSLTLAWHKAFVIHPLQTQIFALFVNVKRVDDLVISGARVSAGHQSRSHGIDQGHMELTKVTWSWPRSHGIFWSQPEKHFKTLRPTAYFQMQPLQSQTTLNVSIFWWLSTRLH